MYILYKKHIYIFFYFTFVLVDDVLSHFRSTSRLRQRACQQWVQLNHPTSASQLMAQFPSSRRWQQCSCCCFVDELSRCISIWPLHGTCKHSSNGPPKVKQQSKSWKIAKNKLKFWGRFKGLWGLGVCGNHRKCIQLHAFKIWCKSFNKMIISWPKYF